jgi:hypothetical protein
MLPAVGEDEPFLEEEEEEGSRKRRRTVSSRVQLMLHGLYIASGTNR